MRNRLGMVLIAMVLVAMQAQAQVGEPPPTTAQPDKFPVISWTASISAPGVTYNVYRGTAQGGAKGRVNATPISALTYKDTAAPFGVPSYYTVTAQRTSSGVESLPSNEVSGVAVEGSLSPPTNINAVVAALIEIVKSIFAGLKWFGTFGGKLA